MKSLVLVLLLCTLYAAVHAHSWIECTDYTEKNGNYWDASKCRGRPREWGGQFASTFGAWDGYANLSPQCNRGAGPVTTTYYHNQEVCLAWPSKNHVSSKVCTTRWTAPDNGNLIYVSVDGEKTWHQIADLGITPHGTPYEDAAYPKGFQNCPKFCENNDKALCTGCFKIPSWLNGKVAFKWAWEFNKGGIYTTCWDAEVRAGTPPPLAVLPETQPQQPQHPTQPTQPAGPSSYSVVLRPEVNPWWIIVDITPATGIHKVELQAASGTYTVPKASWGEGIYAFNPNPPVSKGALTFVVYDNQGGVHRVAAFLN